MDTIFLLYIIPVLFILSLLVWFGYVLYIWLFAGPNAVFKRDTETP